MCIFLLAAGLSVLGVPKDVQPEDIMNPGAKLGPIVLWDSPVKLEAAPANVCQVHLPLHDCLFLRRRTRCIPVLC